MHPIIRSLRRRDHQGRFLVDAINIDKAIGLGDLVDTHAGRRRDTRQRIPRLHDINAGTPAIVDIATIDRLNRRGNRIFLIRWRFRRFLSVHRFHRWYTRLLILGDATASRG